MFNSDRPGSSDRPLALPGPTNYHNTAPYPATYATRPVERPSFEFGLFDILNAMWKRKALMILLPLLAAGGAAYYAKTLPNTYESTAQLLIDPRELNVLDREVVPQGVTGDASAAYLESQARIITSTNMLRRIVEEQQLVDDVEFNKPPTALDRWLGLDDVPTDKTLSTVAALAKKVSVRRGEKTFVIDVTLETEDPDKSARLANAFVDAYLKDQIDSRSAVARRTSTSLTGRLEELQTRVRQAEEKVEAYRRERNIVDANGKRVTDEQLAAVNGQLAAARSRLADTKAKLDQIELVSAGASANSNLPEAVNSPTLGILRQQLGDAERRAANLSITLGARHPDYLSAVAVKRDAERAVTEEIGRIRAAARIEFQRATANEAEISRQLTQLKDATLDVGADAVRLRELQREVDASRSLYQAFLQRSLETGEQEGIDSTNTRVIAEAVPPLEKAGPNRKLLILVAGLLSGMAAAGIAIALELLQKFNRFRREAATAPPQAPVSYMREAYAPQQPASTFAPKVAPIRQGGFSAPVPVRSGPLVDNDTYSELMRVMRRIEEIESAIQRRRQGMAA